MNKKNKKILVVRYRFIGDTLLTVPFLRNLRYFYPDAQIDMLVAPKSGEIIENCPYIDNLIYFDKPKKHRYEKSNQKSKNFFYYIKMLFNNKYDKTYVLKRSLSSALLVFFAMIKERVGFNTECRQIFLTKSVKYNQNIHEVEAFLDILRADNIPINNDYLEVWTTSEEKAKAKDFLAAYDVLNNKKVIIHATSGNRNKEWPKEYFAQIIEYLDSKKDVQILYLGAESDKQTYEDIESLITQTLKKKPINLCGKLSLRESLAIIEQSDLMLGCDSGNLHIASAAGIPVIGIYGPMSKTKWGAKGVKNTLLQLDIPCIPCNLKKKCKNNHRCLKDITPDMVKNAINNYL